MDYNLENHFHVFLVTKKVACTTLEPAFYAFRNYWLFSLLSSRNYKNMTKYDFTLPKKTIFRNLFRKDYIEYFSDCNRHAVGKLVVSYLCLLNKIDQFLTYFPGHKTVLQGYRSFRKLDFCFYPRKWKNSLTATTT